MALCEVECSIVSSTFFGFMQNRAILHVFLKVLLIPSMTLLT